MQDTPLHEVDEGVDLSHKTVLEEAQALVYGNRQASYGHPRDNYDITAQLFNAYINGIILRDGGDWNGLDAADAAAMMLLLKVGRFATGKRKRDTVVDMAGYAEVIARAAEIDE